MKILKNKLSHSSTRMFMECAQKYKFYYIDKLRPTQLRGALLFGTAIDRGLMALLKNDSENKPEQIFQYFWNFQEINGKKIYLANNPDIVYSDSDFDKDLLIDEDWQKLKELYQIEKEQVLEIRKEKNLVSWENLEKEKKIIHNHANWLCMKRKGLIMLNDLKQELLPLCKKILGTQVLCTLENNQDDKIIGFADIVAEIQGYDKPVILDLKTSHQEYEKDSVLTSPQLSLYLHALSDKYQNTRYAGYIVLIKQINKNKKKICSKCSNDGTGQLHKTCNFIDEYNNRCHGKWIETISPKTKIQILIDKIPEQTEKIVIENIDFINQCIKNGIFHRNLNSCKMAYGLCPYFKKCYYNSNEGLVKIE